MTLERAIELGYLVPKILPDGRVAALSHQIYTTGFVVVEETCVTHRWCYEKLGHAFTALEKWDGAGDPPGLWVKQKLPVERMNPSWSRSRTK